MKIISSSYINGDAGYVNTCIEDYSSELNRLIAAVKTVKTAWSGEDADSFVTKYENIIEKLKIYEKDFLEYKKYLSQVQGVFEALENEYNKKINTD